MNVQEISDRMDIADKIHRYCRSVDRLDTPLGHSVFHPDSHADVGAYQGTGRGWIDFICERHRRFLHHSHQVTNIVIDLDGDHAGSEAYVTATLRSREGDRVMQHQFWARYVDEWSRRDGRWGINKRECVIDFDSLQDIMPLNENKRAQRDRTDPSYAVLRESI